MHSLKSAASTVGGVKPGHSFDHHCAGESEAGIFDQIRMYVINGIAQYKVQVREKRAVKEILQMSDDRLRDIGLYRSDQDCLSTGLTSLTKLNAKREAAREQFY